MKVYREKCCRCGKLCVKFTGDFEFDELGEEIKSGTYEFWGACFMDDALGWQWLCKRCGKAFSSFMAMR